MKKAYNDSRHMYELLGHNKGHKTYKYKHTFTTSNLPSNVVEKCKKLRRESPLYPLRLRDLGYDIWSVPRHYKLYRTIPVGTFLDQILKLMTQIQRLIGRRMIHGDVRETNLMVNPSSGDMTMIDFDLLNRVDTFFETAYLGFYCHPPETFLYQHFKSLLEATRDRNEGAVDAIFASEDISKRMDKYVELHSELKIADPKSLHRSFSKADLIASLKDTLGLYAAHLDPSASNTFLQAALRETLLPSFDGYGLAFSLLDFLAHVYPSVLLRVQKSKYDAILQSRISNNHSPYSKKQIRTIRTSLHTLVFDVLGPMTSLRIQDRMNVETAVNETRAIVAEFHESM